MPEVEWGTVESWDATDMGRIDVELLDAIITKWKWTHLLKDKIPSNWFYAKVDW